VHYLLFLDDDTHPDALRSIADRSRAGEARTSWSSNYALTFCRGRPKRNRSRQFDRKHRPAPSGLRTAPDSSE